MQGPLGHVGHVRARITEAYVKLLIAGPAVSLVGRLLGVGRAMPQAQGLLDTKALRLHGWAPHQACMCRGTRGLCMTKLNLIRHSSEGETCPGKTALRGDFPLSVGVDTGEWPFLMSDT